MKPLLIENNVKICIKTDLELGGYKVLHVNNFSDTLAPETIGDISDIKFT